MIRFGSPNFLYLLFIIPLMIALLTLSLKNRRTSLSIFGDLGLVEKLSENSRPARLVTKSILISIALTLLIIASARPQLGTKMELIKRKGIDIVIAIDTSASMNAEDALGKSKGRRIDKAKHEIEALLDILEGDSVGLVPFAGTAHIQCPMTLDYDAVRIFLDLIDTDLIPTPGTAVGKAIEKTINMFDPNEKRYKAVIIITDGEDHVSDPVEAAKEAKKHGIKIFTIGIGSPEGTPIPVYDESGNKTGLKKDRDGNIVLSNLDDVTLEKIALISGGRYFPATLGEIELKKIYSEISKMEEKELGTRKYTHYEDRFQFLIVISLLILVIEAFIPLGVKSNGVRADNVR